MCASGRQMPRNHARLGLLLCLAAGCHPTPLSPASGGRAGAPNVGSAAKDKLLCAGVIAAFGCDGELEDFAAAPVRVAELCPGP